MTRIFNFFSIWQKQMKPWKCLFESAGSVCLKSVNVYLKVLECLFEQRESVELALSILNCFIGCIFIYLFLF